MNDLPKYTTSNVYFLADRYPQPRFMCNVFAQELQHSMYPKRLSYDVYYEEKRWHFPWRRTVLVFSHSECLRGSNTGVLGCWIHEETGKSFDHASWIDYHRNWRSLSSIFHDCMRASYAEASRIYNLRVLNGP